MAEDRVTSKKQAARAEAKVPQSTLSSWLDANFKHVTLTTSIGEGGKRLVVPQLNVELTMALLSTDCLGDWAKVALHFAPTGTIIDKIPKDYYETKLLLVRQLLTKETILNPDNKLALRYLQVLERRDADRWAARKQTMSLKATASEPTAEGGSNGGSGKKTVEFNFEIVH